MENIEYKIVDDEQKLKKPDMGANFQNESVWKYLMVDRTHGFFTLKSHVEFASTTNILNFVKPLDVGKNFRS
jgi:hypothetical protein